MPDYDPLAEGGFLDGASTEGAHRLIIELTVTIA